MHGCTGDVRSFPPRVDPGDGVVATPEVMREFMHVDAVGPPCRRCRDCEREFCSRVNGSKRVPISDIARLKLLRPARTAGSVTPRCSILLMPTASLGPAASTGLSLCCGAERRLRAHAGHKGRPPRGKTIRRRSNALGQKRPLGGRRTYGPERLLATSLTCGQFGSREACDCISEAKGVSFPRRWRVGDDAAWVCPGDAQWRKPRP